MGRVGDMTEPKNRVSSYANVSDSKCSISPPRPHRCGVPAEVVGKVRSEVQQLPQPVHRGGVPGHPAVFVEDVRGDESSVQHPSATVRTVVSCGTMTITDASSADAGS